MNIYAVSISLLAAFYGLFIGSFLNVCIYRIPLNQTIVTVPSHCTTCNHKLAWYDLFPLFSYLFLGGKCRYCKAHISWQYPLVEALNSVVWFFTFYFTLNAFSFSLGFVSILTAVLNCAFLSALIVLSGIDIFYQIVPDKINILIFILGIFVLILNPSTWLSHLIGFFAVSVPFLILMMFGGMGGGDVKLYAAAGFFLGWRGALVSLIIACITGSIIGIGILIPQRKKGVKHPRIPFVPFIATGMLAALLWGDALINWYITTFFGALAA